ncbi:type III secretion system gatekeeper subunit SctW [Hyphomicrobium sp. MC1]|uniref:type III secretion system gatekeeper subunit SctW n=1 Tax=Hyphomicrobium sp. (strain MC1) TaxID=717785 RepID=UPI000213F230|nr:type III secretion system gatekeeper subunit SctW [Hyphomicrobium sp. MC1]CCB66709.1 protein of unknown function [Hyphomicrobium sp. MC1]
MSLPDRIETGISGAARLPAKQESSVRATGQWAGEQVSLQPDPLSLLMDAKEELTFAHSERVESKEIEERNIEEAKPDILKRIERKEMAEELPDLDTHQLEAVSEELRTLRASSGAILGLVRERFSDPSHQYAALRQAAADARDTGDPEMEARLNEALQKLEAESGPAIRAGLNVTRTAMELAGGDREAAATLRASYRDTVFGKPGPAGVYKGILDKFGTEGFSAQIKFLTRAAGDELASTGSSVPAERLRELLSDLSALRTIDTVHERASVMAKRVGKLVKGEIAPVEIMRRLMPLTEEPVSGPGKLLAVPEQCGVPARRLDGQILFMRETRELLAMMPAGVFRDMDARFSVLAGANEAMDQLIEREESQI